MPGYDRILFPVDFSKRCDAIRPYVIHLAQKLGSRVTLLHAIQMPLAAYNIESASPIVYDIDTLEFAAREQLCRFFEGASAPFDTFVSVGDPAARITEFAAENGIGLIAMPTHGYGKFRTLLLGSVTAKVLHDSACPVWTAAHTDKVPVPAHPEFRSILCALDGKPGSAELLGNAIDFAAHFGAKLRIVHAVPDAVLAPAVVVGGEYSKMALKDARDEIAKVQEEVNADLEMCVGAFPLTDWIWQVVLKYAADLLIIGRGTLQGKLGRLRANAHSIIRESPCPVLSF